jgi:UDP-N-acetylmuramoyl-L-alanyl-D-glutamate--2,6-diaminopimelate ligase
MGQAARVADRVILTSDNPRDEDPADIAKAVAEGLTAHPRVETELDRERAIARSLEGAKEDDVIVLAGKGHETEQVAGETVRAFSDAEVARRVLGG